MTQLRVPKETKARKDHRCGFCFEKIKVGEKYMNSGHVFDGYVYSHKSHKYCDKLVNTMDMYKMCDDGLSGDDFVEIVSDKYYCLLTDRFAKDERQLYSDLIDQLRYVPFREKLWFVIRHFNKIEKEEKEIKESLKGPRKKIDSIEDYLTNEI